MFWLQAQITLRAWGYEQQMATLLALELRQSLALQAERSAGAEECMQP